MPWSDYDVVETVAWLKLFIEPGQVTELRALNVRRGNRRPCTESGFFDHDHIDEMARAAYSVGEYAEGVYFVLNPIHPDLLCRRSNRIDYAGKGETTSDEHILARRWLLIDADAKRVSGISATDDEKAHALDAINKARGVIAQFGQTQWVLADSGNGYHLLVRVDLDVKDGTQPTKLLINHIADQLDTDMVKIDRTVFNAARITKLYGTISRKGENTSRRPHRRSKVLATSAGDMSL